MKQPSYLMQQTWQWIKESPLTITFILSVALSLASLSYRASMNPDGMVYVMGGRVFIEEGFRAALAYFNWPFFSILIGITASILHIPYEAAGNLLSILMLSSTCVLMVKITQRYVPNSAWLACLVVLALPAINENRHNIMRENGAWMFLALAIWLAIRTPKRIDLTNAIGPSLALLLAALFRAEFAVFYPALILWQWYALEENRSLANSIKLFLFPAVILAILLIVFAASEIKLHRIIIFLKFLDPEPLRLKFVANAAQIGKFMHPQFGQDGNNAVLAWGLLGYVFNSFIEICYALSIPLAIGAYFSLKNKKSFAPLGYLFISIAVVITIFVFQRYFLSDRYTAPLAMLCIPLITYGMVQLYASKQRVAIYLVTALLVLNSLDNIITTGDQHTHLVEAGEWIQEHNLPEEETYIDFARIAYHANWVHYKFSQDKPNDKRRDRAYKNPKIRYMTIYRHASDKELKWLEGKHLELLAEFTNSKGRKVLILKKPDRK